MQAATIYDRSYYIAKQDGWAAAGEALAAAVTKLFAVRSVVEFGCNTGTLLAAFGRDGAALCGVDGDHVPRDLLRIAPEQFMAADMARLDRLDRRFDLACSLEYAEHLSPARAQSFVALLVSAAPVVLFSAAIPGQGGLGHVNEQRQSWWAAHFAAYGYVPVDCVRPAIYDAPGVDWYYAQNALIYCLPEHVPAGWSPVVVPLYLDLVDERVMNALVRPPDSIGGSLTAVRRDMTALRGAVRRRLSRR